MCDAYMALVCLQGKGPSSPRGGEVQPLVLEGLGAYQLQTLDLSRNAFTTSAVLRFAQSLSGTEEPPEPQWHSVDESKEAEGAETAQAENEEGKESPPEAEGSAPAVEERKQEVFPPRPEFSEKAW